MVLTVLLLTAPTWAAVSVTCTAVDPGVSYEVRVDYSVTGGDANNIRAFGIRIDVNNGAAISDIDVNDTDYYIFPGSIDINGTTGEVDSNGTAVAEGGNDSAYMILEMGSLYAADDVKHPCEPPQSGTLCTFETNKECVVTLTRDTARGGVVNENGSDTASLSGCSLTYADCYSKSRPDWARFDAVGRPPTWCEPRQCHGDYDGLQEGNPKDGYFYVWQNDLNLVIAGWKKDDAYLAANELVGVKLGAADGDHATEGNPKDGYFSVWQQDLNLVVNNWKGNPDANCPN